MEFWTSFLLGLVGSLHCAGMCGPLALALPAAGKGRVSFLAGRAAYNFGRIATYSALGAVFGLVGHAFALAGWQRWLSLLAGAAILVSVAASSRFAMSLPAVNAVKWLKRGFGKLLQQRTIGSLFLLGLLNGLLPCGLVYVACASAAASGNLIAGAASMTAFGVGTLPMMLGLTLVGRHLQFKAGSKLKHLFPAVVVLVAVLLILRGLSLGIPYLSPVLSDAPSAEQACH